MKIAIRLFGPTRRWHLRLDEALRGLGHDLVLERVAGSRLPIGLGLLLGLESRLYRARSLLFEPAPLSSIPILHADVARHNEQTSDLALEPLFDGRPDEATLIDALLQRRAPSIEIRALRAGVWTIPSVGLAAIEQPDVLAKSLDQILVRLIAIILQGINNMEETGCCSISAALPAARRTSPAGFLIAGLMHKIRRRVITRGAPREEWRMALRAANARRGAPWTESEYTLLGDGRSRFQADPFLFETNGRLTLFYEELPEATGRGLIAAMDIDASGDASRPRTVLEQPFHLSYPFVFEHDDTIFMLPETSQARRVQLFRAAPFPDCWVPDQVLLDDIEANDATPIFHEGRYWLFATLSGDGGSSWDQLGLFHASDLLGPWTAHPGNPVLIDAGAARPAGAMWHEDGVLMRIAQDCRGGYGAGLTICRVDRLDLAGFEQTIVARIEPPAGSRACGIHTLNRAGAFEVTDLKTMHA